MLPSSDHFNPRNGFWVLPGSVSLETQGEQKDTQAAGLLWPVLCPLHVYQPHLEGLQGVRRLRTHPLRDVALLLGPKLSHVVGRQPDHSPVDSDQRPFEDNFGPGQLLLIMKQI